MVQHLLFHLDMDCTIYVNCLWAVIVDFRTAHLDRERLHILIQSWDIRNLSDATQILCCML